MVNYNKLMSMIKRVLLSSFAAMMCISGLYAGEKDVLSPDGRLKVVVSDEGGMPSYQVFYDGVAFIKKSPLGLKTNIGDFTSSLTFGSDIAELPIWKIIACRTSRKVKLTILLNRLSFHSPKKDRRFLMWNSG